MRQRKRKWIIATAFAGLFILLWVLLLFCRMDDKKARALADWLRSTNLKPGDSANVKLPPRFRGLASSGTVDVKVQRNGKLAYFLKSYSGYKGNYEGYVYVDNGFTFTISKDYYGRNIIDLFEPNGDYPVIDKKISNNLYAVFFDLG